MRHCTPLAHNSRVPCRLYVVPVRSLRRGPQPPRCGDKVRISALTLVAEELKKADGHHKLAFWLLLDSVLKNVPAYRKDL
eukprot:gene27873-39815_t